MTEIETLEILGGNTNSPKTQINQLKKWVFTLNNYTEQDIVEILETCNAHCDKYGFQTEIGDAGTPHLQGAIWLNKKMRWSEFKLNKNIHWEKMKSDIGSNDYVQKTESYSGRRWNKGLTPIKAPPLCISILRPWQKEIEDIYHTQSYNEYGTGRHVRWYWEANGNIGKTAFVRYMVCKYKEQIMFVKGGKASDLINMLFERNTDLIRCVIWDLPRENEGFVSSMTIECILDGMINNTKYETGTKVFNAPHVFVFSNFPPVSETALSADRWIIKELLD